MANYPFEKYCYLYFLRVGGGGSKKMYVLYTHLNVNNYGWPLSSRAISKSKAASFGGGGTVL